MLGELLEREPVLRGLDERELDDLRGVDDLVAPEVEDFARLLPDFFAPPVDRDALDFELFDALLPLERLAVDLRAPLDRDDDLRAPLDDDPELLPPLLVDASIDHLPDMTRCAASATASAISDPNLVALDMTLLAACDAVSAASRPASRIFFRADGLALMAAAAAARPAASISLLIAAFASLSTVLSLEPERDDAEPERDEDALDREAPERLRAEVLRVDFAIAYLLCRRKDTLRPFRFPNEVGSARLRPR